MRPTLEAPSAFRPPVTRGVGWGDAAFALPRPSSLPGKLDLPEFQQHIRSHERITPMATKKQPASSADLKTNEKKWSKTLMDAGWTALPSVIIENQRQLGLSPLDLNILVYLASKWWTPEGKPFPSKATMAKAMDVHPRTIQKRIAGLEAAGYVRREERRSDAGSKTNVYHLDGLIKAAKPFAEEKIAELKDKAEMAKRRQNRRGAPKLRLVKTEK